MADEKKIVKYTFKDVCAIVEQSYEIDKATQEQRSVLQKQIKELNEKSLLERRNLVKELPSYVKEIVNALVCALQDMKSYQDSPIIDNTEDEEEDDDVSDEEDEEEASVSTKRNRKRRPARSWDSDIDDEDEDEE